jgi:hypothetical protein
MAWRRGSRRMTSYPTDMNEEYAQEALQEKRGNLGMENKQTQNTEDSGNQKNMDQDILLLLEKINLQLENIRLNEQNREKNPKQSKVRQNDENGIEELITQLLKNSTNKSSINNPNQQLNAEKANNTNALLDQLLNQSNTKSAAKEQPTSQQKSNDTLVLQTAAEVLSRAQYELSNELENSLKKLKQVISESEQIANKISNLIEQNSNKER